MSPPAFKWELNVTTLLTVVTMAVTLTFGYRDLYHRGLANREYIEQMRLEIQQSKTELRTSVERNDLDARVRFDRLEERQRAMETVQARYDERHLNILQILGRIEAQIASAARDQRTPIDRRTP